MFLDGVGKVSNFSRSMIRKCYMSPGGVDRGAEKVPSYLLPLAAMAAERYSARPVPDLSMLSVNLGSALWICPSAAWVSGRAYVALDWL